MSYCKLHYHIVFRTYRSIQAIDEKYENELYMYIYNYLTSRNCFLYRVGGMPDHIHLFTSIHQTIRVSDFIHDLKLATNSFLKENPHFPDFCGWGKKYCAITYNVKDKNMIVNYIKNQKTHHESETTDEEFIRLLEENGIDYDINHLDD